MLELIKFLFISYLFSTYAELVTCWQFDTRIGMYYIFFHSSRISKSNVFVLFVSAMPFIDAYIIVFSVFSFDFWNIASFWMFGVQIV